MEKSEAQKSGRGEVQVKVHRNCAEGVAVAKDRKGGFLRCFSPEPGLLLVPGQMWGSAKQGVTGDPGPYVWLKG